MIITYGIQDNTIDVTNICLERLMINNIITIPCGDNKRCIYFTDPLYGVLKKIFVTLNGFTYEYEYYFEVKINTLDGVITTINSKEIDNKLNYIHGNLKFKYGNIYDELPEQKMAVRFLTGNEKVLELGGNIGRNTLVIASILKGDHNFVTLECDANTVKQLTENRDLNNFKFPIEDSALSKINLIQKGWDTVPSDIVFDGFTKVKTINFEDLKTKYGINFDTLVADCEGALYYIFKDMPEILNNINLIIMENDYWDIAKKQYIDDVMKQYNFDRIYVEGGGWGPCVDFFYEAWKKEV
jgi:FkbM family methyltransferase